MATAGVREATVGPDFVKAAEKNRGVKVRVLSGKDEARISSWGVEAAFHKPEGGIGDLGGSSLEFHSVGQTRPTGESLMLGPLSIARDKFEYKPVRSLVREAMRDSNTLAAATGDVFGVGGAWRAFSPIALGLGDVPVW